MSFTDHKITQFAHRVADLPDEPQIPAADLKSRFDACPEELRQSLNAVCDDAARLEARVEGIVVDTFGDTIDKEMLSDELAAELDGKATQSALASETAARESADDGLQTQIAEKCEVYFGSYTGQKHYSDVTPQQINLGFEPSVVMVAKSSGNLQSERTTMGVFMKDFPMRYFAGEDWYARTTENGFEVRNLENGYGHMNLEDYLYYYFALK